MRVLVDKLQTVCCVMSHRCLHHSSRGHRSSNCFLPVNWAGQLGSLFKPTAKIDSDFRNSPWSKGTLYCCWCSAGNEKWKEPASTFLVFFVLLFFSGDPGFIPSFPTCLSRKNMGAFWFVAISFSGPWGVKSPVHAPTSTKGR